MNFQLKDSAGLNGKLTWRPLLNDDEIDEMLAALPRLMDRVAFERVKVEKALAAMRNLPMRPVKPLPGHAERHNVHSWVQLGHFTPHQSMVELPGGVARVEQLGWAHIKPIAQQGAALQVLANTLWRTDRRMQERLPAYSFTGGQGVWARSLKSQWILENVDTQKRLAGCDAFAIYLPPKEGELGGFLAPDRMVGPLGTAHLYESAAAAKRYLNHAGLRSRTPAVVRIAARVTALEPTVGNDGDLRELMGALAQEERRQLEESLLLARKEDLEQRLQQLNAQLALNQAAGAQTKSENTTEPGATQAGAAPPVAPKSVRGRRL